MSQHCHEKRKNHANHAKCCPKIIKLDAFSHVPDRKRDKHRERDNFLNNFQLRKSEGRIAYSVRRNLQKVLKEGNPPAHQCRNKPREGGDILEVRVPCKRYENVRSNQQQCSLSDDWHYRLLSSKRNKLSGKISFACVAPDGEPMRRHSTAFSDMIPIRFLTVPFG